MQSCASLVLQNDRVGKIRPSVTARASGPGREIHNESSFALFTGEIFPNESEHEHAASIGGELEQPDNVSLVGPKSHIKAVRRMRPSSVPRCLRRWQQCPVSQVSRLSGQQPNQAPWRQIAKE